MDLTTGWDRSAEANNDEHHQRGENHQHVPGLRRITQTWPQGEKVVVYQHFGRDITEAQIADLFRATLMR
jgi:hypothetical protein